MKDTLAKLLREDVELDLNDRLLVSSAEAERHPPLAGTVPGRTSDLQFKSYLLRYVYLCTTEEERAEIRQLWASEGVLLDPLEAERRCSQTAVLVRNGAGELVGLSTVAIVRLEDDQLFYAYRMFIRPRDRVPNLMVAVVGSTRKFLGRFQHPDLKPAGMVIVSGNPKLARPGARALFARYGFVYWGQTPYGEEVWGFEFADIGRFREPHGLTPRCEGTEAA